MERINSALSAWQGNPELQKRLDETKQALLKSTHVAQFLTEQETVTDDMITAGMPKLYEYKKERENCDQCPGLKRCPNLMQGYQPELYVERKHIEIRYHSCHLKVKKSKSKSRS